jgi:pimeloyl-ACP methyl ester carboxylesterase
MTGSRTRISEPTGAMDRAKLDWVELEYRIVGSGEPVLLIPPGPLADSFLPVASEEALVERHSLILYHRRGMVGSSHATPPVSFAEQAADAAALLGHLGIGRAHVVGHSTGATIALQLALDRPEVVGSLALLEPPLTASPSAAAFFEQAAPSMEAYGSGENEAAMAAFLSLVSGLEWETCRAVIEDGCPGATTQAIKDADTFFGVDLPALNAWSFGSEDAAAVAQPILSVLGTESGRWFVEGAQLLRSWFPGLEELTVEGAGHLLHAQRPEAVASGVAEFLGRHPITAG